MSGLIAACQMYSDPYIDILENYSFEKSGYDQKTFAGNYLNDSIGIRVSNNQNFIADEQIQVQFEVIDGGGIVDHSIVGVNANGFACTRWKLGEEACEQTVRAKIFNPSGKMLSDISFKAYGFKDNVWNGLSMKPDVDVRDMASDTVNHITYMIACGRLYKQGDNYFDWEEINTVNINAPGIVDVDTEGTLYIGNWEGDMSKSEDNGNKWISCTKPAPKSTAFNFAITKDNYIWATASGYPLQCSRDGGKTWSTDSVGLGSNKLLKSIFRLNDGTYFLCALVTDLYAPAIYKSIDNAKSWSLAQTPGDPVNLYVTKNDEIIISSYYHGFSILKSDDQGDHYTQIYHKATGNGVQYGDFIQKSNGIYYILMGGEGILKSIDLNTVKLYWYNMNLISLFMDHSGVLVAKQSHNKKVYYRANTN